MRPGLGLDPDPQQAAAQARVQRQEGAVLALRDELFVGPAPARPHFEAVRTLLREAGGGAIDRRLVLSGQGLDGVAAAGPTVCACFSVGLAAIQAAIASGGATPEAIGQALRAGTNCGSCVPELRRIIARELAP